MDGASQISFNNSWEEHVIGAADSVGVSAETPAPISMATSAATSV